jgi:ferrous iron transport protein A
MLLVINVLNNDAFEISSLGHLQPGEKGKIVGFETPDSDSADFLRRLFEVGFIEGAQLEVLHEAPYSKDPISIRIKDATYALRRLEASLIKVKKL